MEESCRIIRRILRPKFVSQICKNFSTETEFKPRKALILSKVSRYDYEKSIHKELSESALRSALLRRGSDPDLMRKHHSVHFEAEQRIVRAFKRHGIECKVCKRDGYTDDKVQWADLVVTAGGDGTFLMAASKIPDSNKPIVGFNTDPSRSEGYLCLPKGADFDSAVNGICDGQFEWFMRKRLKVTLVGNKEKIAQPAIELLNLKLEYPEYRYVDSLNETSVSKTSAKHPLVANYSNGANERMSVSHRVLPVLALNEIYVGEALSSRVSYLEVKLNEQEDYFKTRNSGLLIATGTGSTSWTFNHNKVSEQSVEFAAKKLLNESKVEKDRIREIVREYNDSLVFDAGADEIAYTLRDPVHVPGTALNGIPETRPSGYAGKIELKSRCFDAHLVIDGALSFKFNDGTNAIIEIAKDGALRTIKML